MEKILTPNSRRRVAIFIKENWIVGVLLALVPSMIQILQGNASFFAENDTVYGAGEVVNPYFVFNSANIISLIFIFLFIVYVLVWLFVKNAPPLVCVDGYTPNGTSHETYIKIQNNEPSILENVFIKVLKWEDIDKTRANFDFAKPMGSYNLIKVEKTILTGETVEVNLARVAFDGNLYIPASGRGDFPIQIRSVDAKESVSKYKVLLEVFVQPGTEKRSLSAGTYTGVIVHTRLNGFDTFDLGKKIGEVFQETVWWEDGSFRQIEDKKKLNTILRLVEDFAK